MSSSTGNEPKRKPAYQAPEVTVVSTKQILEVLGPAIANVSGGGGGCGCGG